MIRSILGKSKISYNEASHRLRQGDPLAFLSIDARGTSRQEAVEQIHAAVHVVLEDVEKAFQIVFDQLKPDANVADRTILDAKDRIRNEQARARSLVDLKQDELQRQIRIRLENLFLQGLIQAPLQDPSVSQWEGLSSQIVERDEPLVSEYTYDDLTPNKRGNRLNRWKKETDEWLGIICQNHVAIIIKGMEDQIKEYKASWYEVTEGLKKRAIRGGILFQQVNDPDLWNFESEDPTVRNLLNGTQALDIAGRILDRFQISPRDIEEVADTVRQSLAGLPVFGTNRIGINDLEELLSLAVAEKIRDTLSIDAGFLSLVSNGLMFGDDLGELLDEMRRGTVAMEEKLWRVGEAGVGHVDSASGVGITAPNVHDLVLRGLGGGRKFAAVEGHPGNNHRFDVQMSIVGAPASDMTIFREMLAAWYSWHFEEARGQATTREEWMKIVMAECWKLYPDIGVRNAIVALIDEDLRTLWSGREAPPTRPANGMPSDQDLLNELWKELGVIANPASRN